MVVVVNANRFRPGLTALIPEGWVVRESIQLASAEQNAYVVASVDVLARGTTAEQYAGQYEEQLRRRLPGYEEVLVETVELPQARSGFLRKFRWAPPEGEPITELQMYVVENGRVIVSTARAAEEAFDELEPQLRDLLAGIGFGPPAPAGGILRRDDSPAMQTYEAFEAGQLGTTAARAFGLEPADGDREPEATPDQVSAAWKDVRTSWQQVREEL